MDKKGYCLVLSGGGAKGIYHLGAWKALRELNIPIDAAIGNSVGAIVAGFVVQDNFKGLENVADNICIKDFIDIPEELVKDGEFHLDKSTQKIFKSFRRKILTSRGLDTKPLLKLLESNLDENKIRSSGKDLGIITFNVSNLKPREMFLEDIEEGKVCSYIRASSTFPGFKLTEIDNKLYIDGGVYDNMPYAMAKGRGYKKIILIDISGLGVNKRPDIIGTDTVYIKNSINMGGILDFNKKTLHHLRILGYLDTMKVFGRLYGHSYFISRSLRLEKKILGRMITKAGSLKELRALLPPEKRHNKDLVYSFADCAATYLDLPRIREYSLEEICRDLKEFEERILKQVSRYNDMFNRKRAKITIKNIKALAAEEKTFRSLGRAPYFYDTIINQRFTGAFQKIPKATIEALNPETRAGKFFLEVIKEL